MKRHVISKQRVLIALRSFESIAAAARSVRTGPYTLLRMALNDSEIGVAYKECIEGKIRRREAEKRAAEKREHDAKVPRITERAAEKRTARFFAAVGRDPKLAAGALHKRLNREARQERAADLEAAIDAIDDLIAGRPKVPTMQVLSVIDRWCGRCQAERIDDPCEVCRCKTIQHR